MTPGHQPVPEESACASHRKASPVQSICTAHVMGQWVWSSDTGYEPTLHSGCLSPKTSIETIKFIPDEPSNGSSALSELSPCLAMDFSELWNCSKKSNYRLDWFWINSPEVKQISRAVSSPLLYVRPPRDVFFFVFLRLTPPRKNCYRAHESNLNESSIRRKQLPENNMTALVLFLQSFYESISSLFTLYYRVTFYNSVFRPFNGLCMTLWLLHRDFAIRNLLFRTQQKQV